VACCDIAIASSRASFCLSEVKLGLIPAVISPYVIAAIGERASRRYFLTAEPMDAPEALRLGLVHEVVADEALAQRGQELAAVLLKNGPQAMAEAKKLIAAVADHPVDAELIADTATRIADRRASPEGREGLTAFLEKRTPGWVRP
jgi:methylglutaconyl-CoA hydratase